MASRLQNRCTFDGRPGQSASVQITATPWISIMMPGRAKLEMVRSALAGYLPSGKNSRRISTNRSPLRGSSMNTVIVTMLASEPPARSSVRPSSSNTVRVCSSNLPLMSLPFTSVVVVLPASQTMRPPSVMTAGENARLFWCSVPSMCSIFAGGMGVPSAARILEVEAPLRGPGERLGARARAELPEERFDVELDGVQRDAETPRDRLVGEALADGAEDLELARCQEGGEVALHKRREAAGGARVVHNDVSLVGCLHHVEPGRRQQLA